MQLPRQIAIPVLLVRMYARTQLEYRGAFALDRVAQIVNYGAAFATIFLLLNRFDALGGWRWPEMALLMSFYLLAYAAGAACSYTQLREMEEMVRLGTMDVLLVKPYSPWAYLVFSGFNIGYAGHVILALGLIGWAVTQVNVSWNLAHIAFFAAGLFSAAMVAGAILTMLGASALVLVRARQLYAVFFGVWDLSRYPMTIFPTALQVILLTIVPLGFMGYVPVAVLLGKPVPWLGDWAGVLSLLAGPILTLLAALWWRHAINRYQGGGG